MVILLPSAVFNGRWHLFEGSVQSLQVNMACTSKAQRFIFFVNSILHMHFPHMQSKHFCCRTSKQLFKK